MRLDKIKAELWLIKSSSSALSLSSVIFTWINLGLRLKTVKPKYKEDGSSKVILVTKHLINLDYYIIWQYWKSLFFF